MPPSPVDDRSAVEPSQRSAASQLTREAVDCRWLRIARALLAVAIYAVITLDPFEFSAPVGDRIFYLAMDDFVGNIFLTLPVGYLLADVVGARVAMVIMAAMACAVETSQLFLAAREASVWDIIANLIGGAIGARWRKRAGGELHLGHAFVVLALLWMIAARTSSPDRPMAAVALVAALGASVWLIPARPILTRPELLRPELVHPTSTASAVSFAVLTVISMVGLAPRPLIFAAAAGSAVGVLLAKHLLRWWRATAVLAAMVFVGEAFPFRWGAKPGVLGPAETIAFGLATLTMLLAPPPAVEAPAAPAPGSE